MIFTIIIIFINSVSSQWVQTNGPIGGQAFFVAASGSNVYTGTWGGLNISTNNGLIWNHIPNFDFYNPFSYAINGAINFLGSNGVYISTNNGWNWAQTSLNNQFIQSLAVNGTNVYAGTYDSGVYVSTNNGQNWIQSSLNNQPIYSLAISGNIVLAQN